MRVFSRFNKGHFVVVLLAYAVSLVLGFGNLGQQGPASASEIITIQPGVDEGKDATITSFNNMAGLNLGDQADLYGGILRMSRHRALLEFDISGWAPETEVTSAELSLYYPGTFYIGDSINLTIHAITESWDELSVNWLNQPEYNAMAEDSITINTPAVAGWHSFDISDLVQKWVYGELHSDLVNGVLNYGVIIDFSETSSVDYPFVSYSSDFLADPSLRPKLRVQGEEGLPIVPFDTTYQPDSASGKDTQITDMSPVQNYGTENTTTAGVMDFASRSFLEFDLGDLAEGVNITSASLDLNYGGAYFMNDVAVSLTLKRVEEEWAENTINWLNQPGYNTTVQDQIIVGDSASAGWYSFDVGDLVQGWLDGDYQNFGVMIDFVETLEPSDAKTFYSSEYSDDTLKRPKLTIEYGQSVPLPEIQYHKVCQSGSCVDMEGTGDNECDSDTQCLAPLNPTPSHKICQNSSCVTVEGEGVDQCSLDSQCQITASDTPTPAPTLPPAIKPDPDDPPQEEEKPRDDQEPNKIFGPVTPPDDPTNLWQDFIRGLATSNLPLWTLIFAGLFSIISTAFLLWTYLSVEISFRQYFLAIINYISSIFVAKKKNKKGLVYDSSNGRGVSGAIVGLYSFPEMRLVSSAFTDKKGEYYLIARSGNFAISVTAGGFIFPSVLTRKLLVGDASQYFGETINIDSDSAINYKIPLDPGLAFKPNRKFIYKLVLSSNLLRLTINMLGTVLSLVALWLNPSSYNYFIATAYLFLWILEFIVENREIKFSKVVDESSGEPLDLALVRLISEDGKLIKTTASDMVGRILVENTRPSNRLLVERSGYKQSTFNIKKTGFVEGQKFKLQKY